MIIEQLKKNLNQIRLYGVLNSFERRSHESLAEQLHPQEYLKLLLEDELSYRKNLKAQTLANRAKFRNLACLEDWDLSFDRGLTKVKLKDLAVLNFLQNKENLIILGKTGEGKTHLGISLGRRACQENFKVIFYSVNMLFEEIQIAKLSGKYLSLVKDLTKANVVIFDDFGLRNYTHHEATILLDLLEDRYQKGVNIITSQVHPQGWKTLFEDPVIAEAIQDRLCSPSQTITLKGGSYREKLSNRQIKN